MLEEYAIHAIIALVCFSVGYASPLFVARYNRLPKPPVPVDDADLPRPKRAPSDFVIYRYDDRGGVCHRYVQANKDMALVVVQGEKNLKLRGRLFKDGELLEEW